MLMHWADMLFTTLQSKPKPLASGRLCSQHLQEPGTYCCYSGGISRGLGPMVCWAPPVHNPIRSALVTEKRNKPRLLAIPMSSALPEPSNSSLSVSKFIAPLKGKKA